MSKLANSFQFERSYFGERHGKSECDSCGGMIKSFLSQAVASGKAVLRNAEEVLSLLKSQLSLDNIDCSHIVRSFHLVQESSVDRSLSSTSLKTLPGTKKIHSFKVLSSQILAVRQFSCFCQFCLRDLPEQCVNKTLISSFSNIKWPNAKSDSKDHETEVTENVLPVCTTTRLDSNISSEICEAAAHQKVSEPRVESVYPNDLCEILQSCSDTEASEPVFPCTTNISETCSETCIPVSPKVFEPCTEVFEPLAESEMCKTSAKNGDLIPVSKNCKPSGTTVSEYGEFSGVSTLSSSIVDESDPAGGDLPCKVNAKRELFIDDREHFFRQVNEKLSLCKTFSDVEIVCMKFYPMFSSYALGISTKNLLRRDVDTTALQLLPPNRPLGYLPALTVGDGNCMTRALSQIVFGHEKFHIEMRCRITAELCQNKHYYLDEDYVSLGCRFQKNKVLSWIALMLDCHSGEETTDISVIVELIFEKEVFQARQLGQYLGVWQLLAASNVLNCAIVSLYPQKGPRKLQLLFGRAMLPFDTKDDEDIVYVMWSSNRNMVEEHWVANHVVPMIKIHR